MPLEQIRLLHCAEQQALMQKLNAVLRVDMPTDAIYNWKRKYSMLYEATLGFIVYMKPQTKRQMLLEWDRLELPRFYLDIWERMHLEIPWISIIDNAITNTVQPVPELASLYEESKNLLVQAHRTWNKHDMSKFDIPHINMTTLRLGESYQTVVQHHTMAWGLKTDIDIDGPLNCTVADNFELAMIEAADRVADYYSGPFVENALPEFMLWLQGVNVTREFPPVNYPTFAVPEKDSVKATLLYSFQKCEYSQIKCDPKEQLQRVGRITESILYILISLVCLAVVALLSGLSLFPIMPIVAFLIIMAHTWNYRLTCTPNIPNCFFDDVYMWIKIYQPKSWEEYFPEFTKGGQCHENVLWSSVYLVARTPLNFILEFVVYQLDAFTENSAFDTYQEWARETTLKNECFILRLPHLVFIPAILYAGLTFGNVVSYLLNILFTLTNNIAAVFSTVYAMETSSKAADDFNNKLVQLGLLKEKED